MWFNIVKLTAKLEKISFSTLQGGHFPKNLKKNIKKSFKSLLFFENFFIFITTEQRHSGANLPNFVFPRVWMW